MNKEQRNGSSSAALLVYKMHIHIIKPIHCDFSLELRQLVQLRFLLSPVEAIFPMSCQPLDVGSQTSHQSPATKMNLWLTMQLHIPSQLPQARQGYW